MNMTAENELNLTVILQDIIARLDRIETKLDEQLVEVKIVEGGGAQ